MPVPPATVCRPVLALNGMPAASAAIVEAHDSTDDRGAGTASAPVGPSAILIAKNEAANIQDCLASLAFAGERIVVEHGSTDDTAALARGAGAAVLQTADWPGFGPQKNRALDLAAGEWVLSIDADERVSAALANEIMKIVGAGQAVEHDAYEIPRLTNFCGRWIRHCGWSPDHVLRLFRRGTARFSGDWVHERVLFTGRRTGRLKSPLLHYSYPTPSHYWRKLEHYSHAWALQMHRQGVRTSMTRAAASGLAAFMRSYVLRLGFLDGAMGFAVCTMQAQAAFGKYFELFCMNRETRSRDGR